MDFYILPSKAVTLFIGLTMNLILNFQEPMEVSGAKENLINIREVNKGKTYIIIPKTKEINSNLFFYNNKTKYMFYIKYDEKKAHDFINVYDGKKDSSFNLTFENNDYRILSGDKSILLENKTTKSFGVNGEIVKTREVFSKGVPLFINVDGREDYYDKRGLL